MPSTWQFGQIEHALRAPNVPDVLEQFDACAFGRAVQGLDQVAASGDTLFVAPRNSLPNWRDRFGDTQSFAALEELPSILRGRQAVEPQNVVGDRVSFIIPVVHPSGGNIKDYNAVEWLLKQTIRSCLSQSHDDISVIVMCHKIPAWGDAMGSKVTFVLLGDGPEWTENVLDVREDKGKKHLLGAHLALTNHRARAVMFLDGDDLVRRDFAQQALSAMGQSDEGLVVTRGFHAALQTNGAGFSLTAALRIDEFHHTCGSCRIFLAEMLADRINRWWPDFLSLPLFDDTATLYTPDFARFLDKAKNSAENEFGLLRVLGRHAAQSMVAELTPWRSPLVAKGCGHGNHDGPRKGDVHWKRCVGAADLAEFADDFALDPAELAMEADSKMTLYARAIAPFNLIKRLI
ncbi:glycosyltransferase family A protein [Shimia sp. SK013]|uniref:glycosyltransferase family A protein n=1 Tax=Shimia sp. SK013 TaxID=1389006 RepID=UPI0007A38AAC|nr:glycosyltransferase family 2 protein [Shimia sp. SK013]